MRDIAYEQALLRHQRKMLRILDEYSRDDLSVQQHKALLKIVGFRNVLVHDYLDINDKIVQAIVTKRLYTILESVNLQWQQALDSLSKNTEQP